MITTLENILKFPTYPPNSWLFLPEETAWDLTSKAYIGNFDEVTPDEEDNPKAGYPEFALTHGLMETLEMETIQGIIDYATQQKDTVTTLELYESFLYYYDHDAFKILTYKNRKV